MTRDPAMHVWPLAAKMPETTPRTALSRLASSKTDLRRLAAQFQRQPLETVHGDLGNVPA
jgi:hypothetical protein